MPIDSAQSSDAISEGGPTCSTGSASTHGTLDEGEQLTGMVRELQANQAAFKELLISYRTFVFTGGGVPTGRCDLATINSYLDRPFASDRISTEEVKRYQRLAGTIMKLGEGIPSGPKTLRCRTSIGDEFIRAFSEIQTLASELQSALTSLAKSSPVYSKGAAFRIDTRPDEYGCSLRPFAAPLRTKPVRGKPIRSRVADV